MSKLIYPGVVKNDFRMLVTEIDQNNDVVMYRWYLPPDHRDYVDALVEEYDTACEVADSKGLDHPRMWRFIEKKGLKLYLCPWCDN